MHEVVLSSAAAGIATQPQQAQCTDAPCANCQALSQGSSKTSGFAHQALLTDQCFQCTSSTGRDKASLAQHRSLLSPAAHSDCCCHMFCHASEWHKSSTELGQVLSVHFAFKAIFLNGSIFSLNVSQNFVSVLSTVTQTIYIKQSEASGRLTH